MKKYVIVYQRNDGDIEMMGTTTGKTICVFPNPQRLDIRQHPAVMLFANALWQTEQIETLDLQGIQVIPTAEPDEIN